MKVLIREGVSSPASSSGLICDSSGDEDGVANLI